MISKPECATMLDAILVEHVSAHAIINNLNHGCVGGKVAILCCYNVYNIQNRNKNKLMSL